MWGWEKIALGAINDCWKGTGSSYLYNLTSEDIRLSLLVGSVATAVIVGGAGLYVCYREHSRRFADTSVKSKPLVNAAPDPTLSADPIAYRTRSRTNQANSGRNAPPTREGSGRKKVGLR